MTTTKLMSRKLSLKQGWEIRASSLARHTNNLIRGVVENLRVVPNPEKQEIALSVGDPTTFGNLNPPEQVLQAVRECLELSTSRSYGPSEGHMEARQAVAEYVAHQGDVKPEDVILCSGCSHALELAVSVVAERGQNILIPRPGFMIYMTHAEGLGIEVKRYNLLPNQQWKVDLENLESQIDNKTAAIVVTNPSNPCGSVFTKEHLSEIVEIASRHRVPIIADEIYEHMVFSGHQYTAISSVSRDVPVISCGGVTKRFIIPGWKMGWIVVHDRNNVFKKEVRAGLANMSARILGPCTLIQRALPAILTLTPPSFFDEVMLFIENNAKLAYEMLHKAPGLRPIAPQGAMYMMIQIKLAHFSKIKDDLQFVEKLMCEQSVFCLPGKCFEYPNYVRIVLTVPEKILVEACKRMTEFCMTHCDSWNKLMTIESNALALPPDMNLIRESEI